MDKVIGANCAQHGVTERTVARLQWWVYATYSMLVYCTSSMF